MLVVFLRVSGVPGYFSTSISFKHLRLKQQAELPATFPPDETFPSLLMRVSCLVGTSAQIDGWLCPCSGEMFLMCAGMLLREIFDHVLSCFLSLFLSECTV